MLASRTVLQPSPRASKGGLKTKHLVTLFYSSIITTAAYYDSKSKANRRKELDQAIRAEQETLGQLRARDVTGTCHLHTSERLVEFDGNFENGGVKDDTFFYDAMTRATARVARKPGEKHTTQEGRNDQHSSLDLYETLSGPSISHQSAPARPKPQLRQILLKRHLLREHVHAYPLRSQLSGDSIYFGIFDRHTRHNTLSSPKQITIFEHMVAKLAYQLLLDSHDLPGSAKDELDGRMSEPAIIQMIDGAQKEITTILGLPPGYDPFEARADAPRFVYQSADRPRPFGVPWQLNRRLARLFCKHKKRKITLRQVVHKTALLLLTSPEPPNISSINILISEFSKLRRHGLVGRVINFQRESLLQPDEITVTAIMKHYIGTRNRRGFIDYRDSIRHLRSGQFARKEWRVLRPRLRRVDRHRLDPEIAVDPDTAFTLIRGNLLFGDIEDALRVLDDMTALGSHIHVRHLLPFLNECAIRGRKRIATSIETTNSTLGNAEMYYDFGMAIWHEIRQLITHPVGYSAPTVAAQTEALSKAMHFCSAFGKYDEFLESWNTDSELFNLPKSPPFHYRELKQRKSTKTLARNTRIVENHVRASHANVNSLSLEVMALSAYNSGHLTWKSSDYFLAIQTHPTYPKGHFMKIWKQVGKEHNVRPVVQLDLHLGSRIFGNLMDI